MNKQSFDSEKFSKDGITVTTANPIYYNVIPESPQDWYLSLDASSSHQDIGSFQDWLNKNHAGWAIGYPNGVVLPTDSGFGLFGSLTQAAYKNYGDEYLAALATKSTTQPIVTSQPTDDQIAAAKKKGFDWNSAKNKFEKFKESGALDTVLSLVGLGKKPDEIPTDDKLKNPDKPMSTGAKIAIGVGAAAVLIVIIYAATKKSK